MVDDHSVADYFEVAVNAAAKITELKSPEVAKDIANQIVNKKININDTVPAQLVQQILQSRKAPSISSEDLDKIITDILAKNPKAVTDYKNGNEPALMYLVGQVKKTLPSAPVSEVINKIKSYFKE